MKKKSILISLIALSVFFTFNISCKKEAKIELKPEVKVTPVDPLLWTTMEKDSIMFGDTAQAMRVYLTSNLADSLVLRKQSIDVNPDSNDVYLTTLIKRMKKAMIAKGGVGIAAPQIGINRNVIWVKRMDKTGKPFEVYLNCKIIMTSELKIVFNGDGCLSIPGVNKNTTRWRAIGIEYDLLNGSHHIEVIDGYVSTQFTAICFQHEIDHLNGVLFPDRVQ